MPRNLTHPYPRRVVGVIISVSLVVGGPVGVSGVATGRGRGRVVRGIEERVWVGSVAGPGVGRAHVCV